MRHHLQRWRLEDRVSRRALGHVCGRRCATVLQEAADCGNLVITLERVSATMWNVEGHLATRQLDLEVVVLGLFGGSAERFKQLDNIAPVDVVRGGMGEELLERVYKKGFHPKTSLVRRSSLEDVFLRLTGRTLVD